MALYLRTALVGWMTVIGSAAALAQPSSSLGHVVDVVGTVTLTAGDGAQFPAAGARLVLTCRSAPQRVEIANGDGAYRFRAVPAVGCAISTDLQGFGSQTKSIQAAGDLYFHLDVEALAAGLTVRAGSPPAALGACSGLRERQRREER
jgi:hypothetical protein